MEKITNTEFFKSQKIKNVNKNPKAVIVHSVFESLQVSNCNRFVSLTNATVVLKRAIHEYSKSIELTFCLKEKVEYNKSIHYIIFAKHFVRPSIRSHIEFGKVKGVYLNSMSR